MAPRGVSTRHISCGLYFNLLWKVSAPTHFIFELSSLHKGEYCPHWPKNTEEIRATDCGPKMEKKSPVRKMNPHSMLYIELHVYNLCFSTLFLAWGFCLAQKLLPKVIWRSFQYGLESSFQTDPPADNKYKHSKK